MVTGSGLAGSWSAGCHVTASATWKHQGEPRAIGGTSAWTASATAFKAAVGRAICASCYLETARKKLHRTVFIRSGPDASLSILAASGVTVTGTTTGQVSPDADEHSARN